MDDLIEKVINEVDSSELSFCKFISANDAGATGAHQSGFYIPHNSYTILFDTPGVKGENKEKFCKIKWQGDFETESRFIYYGQGTRNEYRITRFGRGFPFLTDESVGNLLVLIKKDYEYYSGYIIEHDEDIEDFLNNYGMSPVDTNSIIERKSSLFDRIASIESHIDKYIESLKGLFPATIDISSEARAIYVSSIVNESGCGSRIVNFPDKELLNWIDIEYLLFKQIERKFYREYIQKPLKDVDELVKVANTVLNRRKSRAGRSLEHHLSEIFLINDLQFTAQGRTEGNKRPDFIFPGIDYYFNKLFFNKLVFLGAKTTCKDRWRQILNEADNIPIKHLFTLQQGISSNQLKEMKANNVVLVVPQDYIVSFPQQHREDLLTLRTFIEYAKEKSRV